MCCLARVCCVAEGVLSGGCAVRRECAVLSRGGGVVLKWGGVLSITESDIKKQPHPPPPGEQNESQTGIKTLPCPKHRVKIRVVCIQVCVHV